MALAPGTRGLAVAAGLAVVYLVWGSTYTAIALGLESLPPLLLGGTRFLAAGALLYVLVRATGSGGERPTARNWVAAALTGTPLLALGNGGVVWAQQRVPSGVAALLVATVPLWIAGLDRLAFGRGLDRRSLVGLALGFGGIALLVDLGGSGGADALGALVLVLAALSWAGGTLLARGAALPRKPLLAASMQMLAGGLVLTLAGAFTGELSEVGHVSARSFGGWVYLVVFGSIVAFSAYGWLLRVAPTSLVATYAFVNPVVAVLLGWLILGEGLALRTVIAGSVIVVAVALIVTGTARAAPATVRRRRGPLAAEPSSV